MTPVQLEVLLHHYYSPEPYPSESSATCSAQQMLLNADLIMPCGKVRCSAPVAYEVTDRGRVYVEALRQLPLPEKHSVWVVESSRLEVPA